MAAKCFYCGSPATQPDFGIPLWVADLVGLGDAPVEHLVAAEAAARTVEMPVDQLPASVPSHAELGGVQPIDRHHAEIEASIKQRAELALGDYSTTSLCVTCAEAVAALDEQARTLLTGMIQSTAGRYDQKQQRILAAWGARMAYAILAVEGKAPGVPKAHRRSLRENVRPHQDVFVGFGRYRPNQIGVLSGRLLVSLGEGGDADADVQAYSVLAVFGHMAMKVFGVHKRFPNTRVKPPEGQMVRVWPPHASEAVWPPLWSLTEAHLDSVFMYEPFYRPFEYTTVRYLGPNKRIKAKRKRTEGLGPRQ